MRAPTTQPSICPYNRIPNKDTRWLEVVCAAGLPRPGRTPPLKNRKIYKLEFKRQARLFQRERREMQEVWLEEKRANSAAARQELQQRVERDADWAEAHRRDTDEQLLAYVRQMAQELGRTPVSREVLGSTYITRRIGAWPLVLICAGLPLPKGMKPPKPQAVELYWRRAEKQVKESAGYAGNDRDGTE